MSGPDLTREKHVERLAFEATDAGFRKVSRTTEVTDRETQIIAAYIPATQRIVVTERELTAFRTGAAPVDSDWRRLSLTLEEARALNARLSRLLAEASAETKGGASTQVTGLGDRVTALEIANAVLHQVEG